ncbi:MAG: hypothetical protein IID45_10525, partial [Planctomycetes bacterium]|nr:hypothetical protein [Planctomycetota bacterium]
TVCLVAPILGLLLAGCGKEDFSKVKVSGKVTYKNQPVKNASVIFQPKGGKSATGTTNDEGVFVLTTTTDGDGAVAGEHTVTIVAINPDSGAGTGIDGNEEIMEPEAGSETNTKKSTKIPEKYGSTTTSGLKFTVKAGEENTADFKLKD